MCNFSFDAFPAHVVLFNEYFLRKCSSDIERATFKLSSVDKVMLEFLTIPIP